ncbi:MAG: hypothetical protein WC966_02335 [Bradymonadales bacterium]|jgi:hypothetical protein
MKRSWRRSALTVIVVFGLCLAVWFWDSQRKVDIRLRTQVMTQGAEEGEKLHLSFIDKDESTAAQSTVSMLGAHGVNYQNLALKPGNYKVRAVFEKKDGQNSYFEQGFEVPAQDAEISLFLRK